MSFPQFDGPLSRLRDIISGNCQSKVLFAALQMGVYELLSTSGPLSLLEVAAQIPKPVATDGLENFERLLKAAVGMGILSYSEGKYVNTTLANTYLLSFKTTGESWAGLIEEMDNVEYSLYGEFKHCAQSGENAWSRMYKGQSGGEARGDMFEHTYKSKDYTERFMKTMYCNAYAEADPVMSAYDLSGYSHVVDIGGAGGLLMISVCKLYPNIKTTVLDLPMVVEIANEVFSQPPYITDTSIRSRIEWITGDIFGPCDAMPKGDLYVLSHILHDWNDKNCDSILERVFAGLLPGGALLISEILLNDDVGPMYGHIMDSIMLVRGEGKERTFKEFVAMLQNAGFTDVQTKKAFFSTDCIIAYKPKA